MLTVAGLIGTAIGLPISSAGRDPKLTETENRVAEFAQQLRAQKPDEWSRLPPATDSWGRPIKYALISIASSSHNLATARSRYLLVWSAGPNGSHDSRIEQRKSTVQKSILHSKAKIYRYRGDDIGVQIEL